MPNKITLLRKNLIWLIMALLIFLGLVQWLGPRYLEYLSSKERKEREISQPRTEENSDPDTTSPATVKTTEEFDGPEIDYSTGKFTPSKLFMKQDDTGFGCILKINNKGSRPLVLRLGPYEMSIKDNYGHKYNPIPPREFIFIDPRFGRRTEEYLNLEKPEEKFYIEFAKTCVDY